MNTKKFILDFVRRNKEIRSRDIVCALKISRQGAVKNLRELVRKRKLLKRGSTRSAVYVSYSWSKAARFSDCSQLSFVRSIKRLEEDKVFNEVKVRMILAKKLSEKAYSITYYAFTEMLNNAIDHSYSDDVGIAVQCSHDMIEFEIADRGIGIFESVRKKFKFRDHYEAMEHLLKGKQTTDPKHHSGQGVFFTSKCADRFIIKSHRLQLSIDNTMNDFSVREVLPKVKGTVVSFCLKRRSRKDIKSVFDEYSNEDYEFDKTRVLVKLSKKSGEYVSRSEAKRIMFGLEKFSRVVLDFEGVPGIGQGFADEVFRVYRESHPNIAIEFINANQNVRYMIARPLG